MALTESRLRQIVREEARKVMREGPRYGTDSRDYGTMYDRGPDAARREREYHRQDLEDRGGGGYDEYDEDEVDFPEDEDYG
jgi:hypothetical protein